MRSLADAAAEIRAGFSAAGCDGALHVIRLSDGLEIGVNADRLVSPASTIKVLVALEFYAQAEAGELDPTQAVETDPRAATPGPVGLSSFRDPARLSLRDLACLMLTISDNVATDAIIAAVGIDRVNARAQACGCADTVLTNDMRRMIEDIGVEMGFASYAEFDEARQGRLGEAARARSLDEGRTDASSALDPTRGWRTTARDMTRLLCAVWTDAAAGPESCAMLRQTMSDQVTRRMGPAVPDGGGLAAKSGSLLGRVRNEVGVIVWPDGAAYAFAVFTRAHRLFAGASAIDREMAAAVTAAIQALRSV